VTISTTRKLLIVDVICGNGLAGHVEPLIG